MPKIYYDCTQALFDVEQEAKKVSVKASGTMVCVENSCYGREKLRAYVTMTAAEVSEVVKMADIDMGKPYLAAHVARVLICASAVRALVGHNSGVSVEYMEKDKLAVASDCTYAHLYIVKIGPLPIGEIAAYVMGDSAEWLAGAAQPGN